MGLTNDKFKDLIMLEFNWSNDIISLNPCGILMGELYMSGKHKNQNENTKPVISKLPKAIEQFIK